MENDVDRILARKKQEVEAARSAVPLDELKARVADLDRPRNFFKALVAADDRENTRVIAEIRQRSPSRGTLRADFDPVAIARAYHRGGASAISCATDEPLHGGRLEHLTAVKQATPLPVLRHDFLVDEYQIWESRAAGADAILLHAETLSEGQLIDSLILATELGLTSLVEAHDVENLLKAKAHVGFPHPGYGLLGIDNRDPRTGAASLAHSFRLAELLEERDILVSDSGIATRDDLRRLREHGINIVLLGDELLPHPDIERALLRLLGENV
jgi:indole-3-glycerol phosphate synthase